MAKVKDDRQAGYWGERPRKSQDFDKLISPLGEDVEETPTYSPSRDVTGAKGQGKGRASQSQSARAQRRGE